MNPSDIIQAATGISAYVVAGLVFATLFLVFLFLFLTFAGRAAARDNVSRRLNKGVARPDKEELRAIRKRRSLSADGGYAMPMISLNRLIVQSGVSWGTTVVPFAIVGSALAITALAAVITANLIIAAAVGVALGAGIPLLVLVTLRRRRLRQFEAQLPEAIDTLVRALKAGHPVSAAIRMVVRELPEPLGAEFAIVADELTYGLDLEAAMNNVSMRVGQQDLALLVIAIGIQTRSGGNLAELLAGIAKVIRDRSKMRLKVKALSAEGRFSAVLLSVLPFLLFGVLALIAPQYYGEIWGTPLVKPALIAAAGWMVIGDVIMYRMVKFRI